jgi:hypothetical protein
MLIRHVTRSELSFVSLGLIASLCLQSKTTTRKCWLKGVPLCITIQNRKTQYRKQQPQSYAAYQLRRKSQ